MKYINFLIFCILTITTISCSQNDDFTVNEKDCAAVQITSKNNSIRLEHDTAWYISQNGYKSYSCDYGKTTTLFNVMRDIQVMGISNRDANSDFDCEVIFMKQSGKTIKKIKLSAVPNSSQMVATCGGECYIIGVPGLNSNPIVNFQATEEYWKDLSLLEINANNISEISVENYVEPQNSFRIETNLNQFVIFRQNRPLTDFSQENIRKWLGSISNKYAAAEYLTNIQLDTTNIIYQLSVRTRSGQYDTIKFYMKYNLDNKPDFNKMYFTTSKDTGTAKYYNFEKILLLF